jgi:uncharacterized protein GlcG (DUF336 family)
MKPRPFPLAIGAAALLLASCGGGGGSPTPTPGGGGGGGGGGTPSPQPPPLTAPAFASLSSAEVGQVVAQAASQASQDGRPATIAVVDRVGNVLAVFRMTGASTTAQIPAAPNGTSRDAQGLTIPAAAAAIAKAITGAYLSSGGNAFSSRTASMIVQQHFPPAPSTAGLESGPLFGVQFSQLPCSDLSSRFGAGTIGPKRSPLGLAADPGGFPLYKNGVLVGGVGAIADGSYSFDANVLDTDVDMDERIALAGTLGFEAPTNIRADRITVDGTSLRYSDVAYSSLSQVGGTAFGAVSPSLGGLLPVTGYFSGSALIAGEAYGSTGSGLRSATSGEFSGQGAFVLANNAGGNRYPIQGGTDGADVGQPLTAAESRAILEQAYTVMARARAQIRQPLDSRAQVTISLVDTRGQVLGIVRAPDAPVFGIDVSLQKARSAMFFSAPFAAAQLNASGSADVRSFVGKTRTFLGDNSALTGGTAFADRSIGNLARPYFPDGEVNRPNGPLSRPIAEFNPFSTGLQSALVVGSLAQHLAFVGGSGGDTPQTCTDLPNPRRLANGLQIFPGSVPVYRAGTLVGGIGVSGDGIDQDDMISFLGLNNAGAQVGGIGNAAPAIRADQIVVAVGSGVRLRYVNCPFAPFLDSTAQNVCQGL